MEIDRPLPPEMRRLIELFGLDIFEDLQNLKKNIEFVEANHTSLLAEYPEKWVVIYQQEVIGAGSDISQTIELVKSKNISPGKTYIRFLTKQPITLILPSLN
ncbi:hypothetical protein HY404_01615 [Candidatus Microgenomates bacterium]|nr:hypothetical protein [Candidatus Microgenomates bacterium]